MRAEKKRDATNAKPGAASPSPRKPAQSQPVPAPTKPVVDADTPIVAVDETPSAERHPQRREGNLASDAGVKVIRTTARDVRRRERETREADGKRLAEAGSRTSGVRRSRSASRGPDQAGAGAQPPAQPISTRNSHAKPTRRAGSPVRDGQAASGSTAPSEDAAARDSEAGTLRERVSDAAASSRELATNAQGFFSRVVEYVRTHVRLTVTVCVIVVVLALIYWPVRDYYVAWRRQGVLQAQYEAVSADHDNLESDVDRLQSREGIEDEARRQGYGYKDENTLSTEGVGDDPNQGPSPLDSHEGASEDVPWYIHVGDVVFFYTPPSQG